MLRTRGMVGTIGLVCVLVISSVSQVHARVPKAGATCSKAGQKITANGKVFTCVKRGTRVVWSKGVAVRRPAQVQPTATPTPPPTPTPSPSSGPTTPVRPVAPLTLDTLDPYWTKVIAYERLDDYARTIKPIDFVPVLYFSPNIHPELQEQERRLLKQTIDFWSPVFVPTPKHGFPAYQVIFFDNQDADWAAAKAKETGNQPNFDYARATKEEYCNYGNAGNTLYFVACVPDWEKYKPKSLQTTPHEYIHSVQYGLVGDWKDATLDSPCWIQEGGPTFYGMYHGTEGKDPQLIEQRIFFRELALGYDWHQGQGNAQLIKNALTKNDVTVTTDLIRKTSESVRQRNPVSNSLACYYLGALMTEALTAVYGHEPLLTYMKGFSTNRDWSVNFQRAYGLTPTEFYAKVTPYLAAVAARDL